MNRSLFPEYIKRPALVRAPFGEIRPVSRLPVAGTVTYTIVINGEGVKKIRIPQNKELSLRYLRRRDRLIGGSLGNLAWRDSGRFIQKLNRTMRITRAKVMFNC